MSDAHWTRQQKMTKGLKFWIYELERLAYLCSENKGAVQLHGYHLFSHIHKAGFSYFLLFS